MRRLSRRGLLAVVAILGCAQIGQPPGGPPDAAAPRLVATLPDSLEIIPGFNRDVEFRFDEIVSEGNAPNFGLGTGDLEKLILLSPTDEVPVVKWKKNRITVKPREGWRPDRVYRVELLPGIMDLSNNRSPAGRVVTFTTGAPMPGRILMGRVVDWSTQRPQALALVEAMLLPDSLRYRTTADSTGRFRFGPLPEGEFLVAGVIDQNRNNRFDPRENFDTLRLAVGQDTVGELWAFRHDTVAARIQTLASNDTLTIAVTFNQQLDPFQVFRPDSVRVVHLPDSTRLAVDTVVTQEQFDSLFRRSGPAADTAVSDSVREARARADSIARARADSVARADSLRRAAEARRRDRNAPPVAPPEGPLTTKPKLFDRILIRLSEPLVLGDRYAVEVHGIRSVSGVPTTTILGFQVPRPPAVPVDTTRADSTRVPPDTAAVRPDTVAVPPDTGQSVRRGRTGLRRFR